MNKGKHEIFDTADQKKMSSLFVISIIPGFHWQFERLLYVLKPFWKAVQTLDLLLSLKRTIRHLSIIAYIFKDKNAGILGSLKLFAHEKSDY